MKRALAMALSAAVSAPALAAPSESARFHNILMQEVRASNPGASMNDLKGVHFAGDEVVQSALSAGSLEDALKELAKTNLVNLTKGAEQKTDAVQIKPRTRPLTLVIVPGVFAEFIKNRAFEEVFERPSALREEFRKQVAARRVTDRVSLVRLYQPGKGEVTEERSLDQVISMGEIKAGGQTVRVILFGTEFATMESLGDAHERAALFNRRLEKYLELTGPQDMAFIGYSRGTILGLEMLAQAESARRPWVSDVKAMISLSGVVWGSSLADDVMENANSPMHKIMFGLKDTVAALKLVDPGASLADRARTVTENNGAWLRFLGKATSGLAEMNKGKPKSAVSGLSGLLQVDPRAPLGIVLQMRKELGLNNFFADYNDNIVRFQYFVGQLLASVKELSTAARLEWWKTSVIPENVTYYAITAAMANPAANAVEAALYKSRLSYGQGSFDDANLLQNRLDYEKISGISLNDSQVSVVQSAFLPNVIASLNPANAGVKCEFLGIAGTHHWGMALREVNRMLGKQVNGFPREAMLKALATQVMLDNQ